MKMIDLRKEWVFGVMLLAPTLYMIYEWKQIPDSIPLHFGLNGKADRWGSKDVLVWLVPVASVLPYLALLLVPFIDPKRRINATDNKFFLFKLVLVSMVATVFILFVFSVSRPGRSFIELLFPALSIFLVLLGNYLQTIRPNYFIGFRTPWALHDDENWRKTQTLASRVFVFGGILLLICSLVWRNGSWNYFYFPMILVLVAIPFLGSFLFYRSKQNQK